MVKSAHCPLVTLVVPIFHTEAYLPGCVESLLGQSYENLEILLVDDGSPDGCPALCDGYAARDHRVRVIHKENGGLSSAREAGIRAASGEYLMVVDSDDWIDPDTVGCCVAAALRDNADCVMFGYLREYPGKQLAVRLFDRDLSCDEARSEALFHRRIVGPVGRELRLPQRVDCFSSVCMKLYRTEKARGGRIVSQSLVGTSEDTVFNLYALERCRISYLDRCFYHYRKTNPRSVTTAYKPGLPEKWDILYGLIREYIDRSGKAEAYVPAFRNRVACGMIGLGLNEIAGGGSLREKACRLAGILRRPLYGEAFARLDTGYCPLPWKLFFLLCRKKAAMPLALLLEIINLLRPRAGGGR